MAYVLSNALREAELNPDEVEALRRLLITHYQRKSSYSDVTDAIEAEIPKASHLRKLIPPADVAGFLALIVALLSLLDDFVANWIRPGITSIRRKGGNSGNHTVSSAEFSRPLVWRNNKTGRIKLHGSWRGNTGLEPCIFYFQAANPFGREIYEVLQHDIHTWYAFFGHASGYNRHYAIPEPVGATFLLFARDPKQSDFTFYGNSRLNVETLRKVGAFPFRLAGTWEIELRIVKISLDNWLQLFRGRERFRR